MQAKKTDDLYLIPLISTSFDWSTVWAVSRTHLSCSRCSCWHTFVTLFICCFALDIFWSLAWASGTKSDRFRQLEILILHTCNIRKPTLLPGNDVYVQLSHVGVTGNDATWKPASSHHIRAPLTRTNPTFPTASSCKRLSLAESEWKDFILSDWESQLIQTISDQPNKLHVAFVFYLVKETCSHQSWRWKTPYLTHEGVPPF